MPKRTLKNLEPWYIHKQPSTLILARIVHTDTVNVSKKKCVKGKLRKGQRLKEKYHQNAPKDSDRIKGRKRKAIHGIIISAYISATHSLVQYEPSIHKPRHHDINGICDASRWGRLKSCPTRMEAGKYFQ